MRRLFAPAYGAVVLSVPLFAMAAAMAQADDSKASATPPPAQPVTQPSAATPTHKRLHTIPEDGMATDQPPAATRFVREIMAARPSEDLIICVAGCYSHRDKIIYAQPVETPPPAPKQPMADAAPAAKPAPSAAAGKSSAEPVKAAPAATTVINAAPSAAAMPAEPAPSEAAKDSATLPQLVPTMALPEAAGTQSAAPVPEVAPPADTAPKASSEPAAQDMSPSEGAGEDK